MLFIFSFAFSSFLFPNSPYMFELIEVPEPIKLWANHKDLMRNMFILKLILINVVY